MLLARRRPYTARVFTGLVQAVGRIAATERPAGSAGPLRLAIDPHPWLHQPALGDSIAVSGVCLTLVAIEPRDTRPLWLFDAIPQTLALTTLGSLRPGDRVNLEHALRAGDPLGGHFVQGHVDGVAHVARVQSGHDFRLSIAPPHHLRPCIVPQGSITLDGVSLTIASVAPDASTFDVALIPETLARTTLADRRPGDRVNIEADMLTKTVLSILQRAGATQ